MPPQVHTTHSTSVCCIIVLRRVVSVDWCSGLGLHRVLSGESRGNESLARRCCTDHCRRQFAAHAAHALLVCSNHGWCTSIQRTCARVPSSCAARKQGCLRLFVVAPGEHHNIKGAAPQGVHPCRARTTAWTPPPPSSRARPSATGRIASAPRMLNTRGGVSSLNDLNTNNTRILARKTCT